MIRSQIEINGGEKVDFQTAYGFIYIEADERFAPDEKEDAVSSYAETAGEIRDGRTVAAPFDYKAKFLIEAPNKNMANVNSKIAIFNAAIREQIVGTDTVRKKEITFYNPLNGIKIVGYPDLVAVPTETYRSNRYGFLDYAIVELNIRVADPTKCDFNLLSEVGGGEKPPIG